MWEEKLKSTNGHPTLAASFWESRRPWVSSAWPVQDQCFLGLPQVSRRSHRWVSIADKKGWPGLRGHRRRADSQTSQEADEGSCPPREPSCTVTLNPGQREGSKRTPNGRGEKARKLWHKPCPETRVQVLAVSCAMVAVLDKLQNKREITRTGRFWLIN